MKKIIGITAAILAAFMLAACGTTAPAASPSTSTAEATGSTIASSTTAESSAQASGVGQVSDLAELAAKICKGPPIADGEVETVYGNHDAHTSPIASDELICQFYDGTRESDYTQLDLTLFNPAYTLEGYLNYLDPGSSDFPPDMKPSIIEGPSWVVMVLGVLYHR